MRQIIFRGKRVDKNEFVFGDLIHGVGSKHGRMYILPVTHTYPQGCNNLDGWEVMPETVGQFTGLTDKNGKEIYEGDICNVDISRYDSRVKNKHYQKTDVRWYGSGLTLFGVTQDLWESERIEIIGNIHDTPELLTK